MKKSEIIEMLSAVAKAAHELADGTCDDGGCLTVDSDDFDALSLALDALDELPEPGINLYGTGPAKARYMLAKSECSEKGCEFEGEICRCASCDFSKKCGDCEGIVDACNPHDDETMCENKKLHRDASA